MHTHPSPTITAQRGSALKSLLAYIMLLYIVGVLAASLGLSHWQKPSTSAPIAADTAKQDAPQSSQRKNKKTPKPAPPTNEAAPTKATSKNKRKPDFGSFTDVKQKKQAFADFFIPIIKQHNSLQLERRQEVIKLNTHWESEQRLSASQMKTLKKLCTDYRVDDGLSENEQLQVLMRRVNIIPPSMVLAQAATESAWGTSRFARKGNNYFGQWCFTTGCGIVPSQRNSGAKHEIAVFTNAYESVRAYYYNINTYPPYKPFRALRQQQWEKQGKLDSIELVTGLMQYSERREEYVHELQAFIRYNKYHTRYDH